MTTHVKPVLYGRRPEPGLVPFFPEKRSGEQITDADYPKPAEPVVRNTRRQKRRPIIEEWR